MDSKSHTDGLYSATSSTKRFSFETDPIDYQCNNSHSDESSSKYESQSKENSVQSAESHSPSRDDAPPPDLNSDEEPQGSPFNQFVTTSMDIPDFDPELLRPEYMSQNIFDQNDGEPSSFEPRDDCEIVNIVHSGSSNNGSIPIQSIDRFTMPSCQNGSTSNPILVDDSLNSSDGPNHDSNIIDVNNTEPNSVNRIVNLAQNRRPIVRSDSLFNTQIAALANSRDLESDDCIMGPIHWGNKRPPQFPLDYYRTNRNFSNAYKFLDTERPSDLNSLEDIEFLFKCPICYSTITRLRSGKVPNDNDKVIYSTKCGHLFCYECIESVKSRKECSICRKPVRDKYQYHVVFP